MEPVLLGSSIPKAFFSGWIHRQVSFCLPWQGLFREWEIFWGIRLGWWLVFWFFIVIWRHIWSIRGIVYWHYDRWGGTEGLIFIRLVLYSYQLGRALTTENGIKQFEKLFLSRTVTTVYHCNLNIDQPNYIINSRRSPW